MKAIVLCAGFGSRLAPLTDRVPKPLVPVANRPVLDLVLDRLLMAGCGEVGINLHHRADQIRAHLEAREADHRGPGIRAVYEPEILDTGGGVANFRAWIEDAWDDEVVVHNSDVVTDIDVTALLDAHRAFRPEVTVALVDHAPTNVVAVAPDGRVVDIHGRLGAASAEPLRTFSGVTVLSRQFLSRLVPGRKSSLIDAILQCMREWPGSVRGFLPEAVYWRDLGRVAHYLEMHREILVGGRFRLPGADAPPQAILVDPRARIEPSAKLEGFVVVGPDCHIESGVHLANCVVWPGTHLGDAFRADDAVISQDLVVAA